MLRASLSAMVARCADNSCCLSWVAGAKSEGYCVVVVSRTEGMGCVPGVGGGGGSVRSVGDTDAH